MRDKIKVCFILPTLFAGGAERVISFVSQNLDKNKFAVTLVVIGYEKNSKFKIEKIPAIYLNKDSVSSATISLIRTIIKLKPNIVVGSISHLNIMLGFISVLFPSKKFIGRQATINKVAKHYRTKNKDNFKTIILNKIFNFGFRRLDAIICQSRDMKEDVMHCYNFDGNKISVIHNPITKVGDFESKSEIPNDLKKFITVGRLGKIKGHDRLLRILSQLNIDFIYTIIGNGPRKDKIFQLIDQLSLSDKVIHIPHTDNVYKYLSENDMFLQGSFSEGFPNALLESCVAGTPVVAFNVPGGTKEIVTNGVNGYLVESEDEFIQKLQENRSWNAKEVSDVVYKKFNEEKILKQYEDLFIKILD